MSHVYDYPRPCVSCGVVAFDMTEGDGVPQLLLVNRKKEPFKGMWSLPSGFLDLDEELKTCAQRELYEETGVDLDDEDLWQVFTTGRIVRDPRARTIMVVYTAMVNGSHFTLCAGDDAQEVAWFRMDELPTLAADHLEIVRKTLGKVYYDRS